MQTQTVEFAVTRNKGNITRVGKTGILQPKTNFKGGRIKWYEDNKREEQVSFTRQRADGSNYYRVRFSVRPFSTGR